MPNWLAILLGFLGSAGVFTFIEFLIQRHDNKKGLTAMLRSEIKSTLDAVNDLRADFEESKALDARRRILQISDELLHDDRRHSKEYFDQVLDDINKYKKYCDDHPKFENERAVASIANIRRIYDACLAKKDFL